MSTTEIDQLVHAIANISHIERPCLQNLLAIKKLEIAKEPVDKEHLEAQKKVTMWETEIKNLDSWSLQWLLLCCTCGIKHERENTRKGLEKALKIVEETEIKVQAEKDKIHEVEVQNEKYSIDYRQLQKYREDITLLLDNALEGVGSSEEEKSLKQAIENCKSRSIEQFENIKKLEKVKDLIKNADISLLEAILELRASTAKETLMGEGKVYFPQIAYDCLTEARQLYPELPGFKSPTEYVNEPDETGAYYSPMQKYLWDVRKRLTELVNWCDEEDIVLLTRETDIQIELGAKIDQYNMERRRNLKERS